ncbi:MAG TPA: galactose oxidase-like domain-containing protein, partial [Pseudonocardiaceae bacterium]
MRARLVTRGARGRWAAVLGAGAIALGLFVAMPALAVSATPGFVQQAYTHAHNVSTLSVTLTATTSAGDRLVVEVGVWRNGGGITSAVTDSANDVYVEVTSFTASDGTEMSVWTAPVTSTSTTKPTVTAKTGTAADVGIVALDYSGLSSVSDAAVVDRQAHATGRTVAAATVSSGATAAATADNELAVGFYADSGFGDAVTAGTGFTPRVSMTPTGDIEAATEDKPVATGALPNATFGTGANTVWLAAVVVFKPGVGSGTPTVPGVPTGVSATAGDGSAAVTWSAPPDGGSPITSYTVTPYVGSAAQPSTVVSVTSAAVGGLTNGTTYTFTVTATNAVGAGLASVPSNPVTPMVSSSPGLGEWSPLRTWPLVAIQSVLMHNGNFLVWDGWSDPQPTNVWNPATQAFTSTTAPASIFCAGLVQMADGRMMTVGGYGGSATNLGITDADVFDPATSTWSRLANMHLPRWYPTVTELADGRYVAISGNSNDGNHWSDTPEVYDPNTNTWTLLSTVSTSQVHEVEYPFSYLTPSGKVFTIGPSEDQSFSLDVGNQTWTPMGSSGVVNGSSDMYRPGKILYTGGAADVNTTTPARSNAAVIDLNGANPTWQPAAPMNHSRVYHTLTTLADGTVLAVGGESTSDQNVVTSGVLPAEIWNPDTNVWSTVASMSAARNYHSTAVLMPDGRVLVAGGGHVADNSGPGEFSQQIYSPPYLFNGPRPTITQAPASATYASTMSVSTPDAASITGVNLVSLGADTHQGDMDEHFVPLSFTAGSGGLTVQSPAASSLAPPGYYMLFLVNNKGVPSMAATVRITAT